MMNSPLFNGQAFNLNWPLPRPGDVVAGKYVIEGPCGRGGLAAVYCAHQTELARRVAIKVLLPEWAGDRDVVERFMREGRAATQIQGEHVAHVIDVGVLESGVPYLVLEYLEGHDLDEVLRTWGPLPVPTAVDWLLQAGEAIAEAHAYGIVHRDLKPSNLFLTQRPDGTACIKVIDFGLSKSTQPGVTDTLTQATDVLGSPHYMSPEQLRSSHEADARSDVWALGAVLYELLSGRPPFHGETVPDLCATVLTQPAPRLSLVRRNVPPAIEQAVLRCLQKDPDARFSSVAELARALAPYGTRLGRASCERIERTLGVSPRWSSGPSLLPPMPSPSEGAIEDYDLDGEVDGRALGTPASSRVVLGSLLMLTGLFAGIFMWVYADVHRGEPVVAPSAGAAEMQPAQAAPAASSAAPASSAAMVPSTPSTVAARSATATVRPAAEAPAHETPAHPAAEVPAHEVAKPLARPSATTAHARPVHAHPHAAPSRASDPGEASDRPSYPPTEAPAPTADVPRNEDVTPDPAAATPPPSNPPPASASAANPYDSSNPRPPADSNDLFDGRK